MRNERDWLIKAIQHCECGYKDAFVVLRILDLESKICGFMICTYGIGVNSTNYMHVLRICLFHATCKKHTIKNCVVVNWKFHLWQNVLMLKNLDTCTLFARNSIAAEATMALDRVHKMQNLYLFMSKDKWKERETKITINLVINWLVWVCVWFVLTSMKIKTKHLMNEWEKTLVFFWKLKTKIKLVCLCDEWSQWMHTYVAMVLELSLVNISCNTYILFDQKNIYTTDSWCVDVECHSFV